MTELKGKIKVSGRTDFTCCESIPRILIDDIDLHSFIKGLTELTEPYDSNENYTKEGQYEWNIAYCTSEYPFTESSFEECAASKQFDMLYSEEVTGCYSVWTCGRGDYNFLLSKEGHSLFTELEYYNTQYVWINFGEHRITETD